MQRLILLRHAKAETSDNGGDFARSLTARGRSEALAAGHALAAHGLVPDLVLVSAAARAVQTWEIAATALPPLQVQVEQTLYHAGADRLLEAAEDSGAACVMLVAHNPGLHELALDLAGRSDSQALARLRTFAPATIAAFRFAEWGWRLETALHPGEPLPPVYKILPADDWADAMVAGAVAASADDARDGFIHLSAADQVAETARRHFHGREDLVLIAFDPALLGPTLRWEASRGGALFPHLYGSLPVAAATAARPLPLGSDGAPDPGDLSRP